MAKKVAPLDLARRERDKFEREAERAEQRAEDAEDRLEDLQGAVEDFLEVGGDDKLSALSRALDESRKA